MNEQKSKYLGHIIRVDDAAPASTIAIVTFEHGEVPFESRMACHFLDDVEKDDVFELSGGVVSKRGDKK